MKKALPWLSLAVLIGGLSASCILMDNPEGEPGWRTIPDRKSKERPATAATGTEFRDSVDFAPGGTLSLENDYGDVRITGWDRDSVRVVAKTAAIESERSRSARESRVRDVTPRVEIREREDGLLIRTPTFEGPGDPPEVSYDLQVPSSVDLTGIRISEGNLSISDVFGRLEASVDKGDLSVGNFSGSLQATVGTGDADVEVLDLREGDEITISTRRGDIVLRLEQGVGAIVEADAPRGEVLSDFDLGKRLPASTVKGWIGQGGPSIILRASDGRIEIVRTRGDAGPGPLATHK
jgi:hypothetical protein